MSDSVQTTNQNATFVRLFVLHAPCLRITGYHFDDILMRVILHFASHLEYLLAHHRENLFLSSGMDVKRLRQNNTAMVAKQFGVLDDDVVNSGLKVNYHDGRLIWNHMKVSLLQRKLSYLDSNLTLSSRT